MQVLIGSTPGYPNEGAEKFTFTPLKINMEPKNGGLVQIIFRMSIVWSILIFAYETNQGVTYAGVSCKNNSSKKELSHLGNIRILQ